MTLIAGQGENPEARMKLIADAGGFPDLEIAGKVLAGWLFIDMDGARSTYFAVMPTLHRSLFVRVKGGLCMRIACTNHP